MLNHFLEKQKCYLFKGASEKDMVNVKNIESNYQIKPELHIHCILSPKMLYSWGF